MTVSSGFPLGDIGVSPDRTGAFSDDAGGFVGLARPHLVGDPCLSPRPVSVGENLKMGGRERVPASGTLHVWKRAPQPELPRGRLEELRHFPLRSTFPSRSR